MTNDVDATRPTTHDTAVEQRPPAQDRRRRRERATRAVAAVLAAVFLLAFGGLPTLLSAPFGTVDGGTHALHHVAEGLHLTLLGVTMVMFAAVPRWRPAAFQLYLAAGLPAVIVAAVLRDPVAIVASIVVLGLPAMLLHQLTPGTDRRALLAAGTLSAPLAALALAAAVPLGRYAWAHVEMQRTFPAGEVHAALQHWSGMAVFAATIVALTLVVARRPAGWIAGAVVTGASLALLGVASLALSPVPSSLGVAGGWAAVVAGLAFVAVAHLTARATPRSTS